MGYLERAKSMHGRGNAVRASVILAEGLKRDPRDSEALEWFLHLYVEELENPGLERELLAILGGQPNGADLLKVVELELEEVGRLEKLEALRRVHARDGGELRSAAVAPTPPNVPSPGQQEAASGPPPSTEHWDAFESPLDEGRPEPSRKSSVDVRTEVDGVADEDLGTIDTLPPDLRAEYGVEALPALGATRRSSAPWILLAVAGVLVLAALGWYALRGRSTDVVPAPGSWSEQGQGVVEEAAAAPEYDEGSGVLPEGSQ